MTQSYRGIKVTGNREDSSFSDLSFHRCTFDNCMIRPREGSLQRPLLQRIDLRDAAQSACFLTGVAIEDVSLHNLTNMGGMPLFLWAAVFKHVSLSGKITAIKINRGLQPVITSADASWDASCKAYYADVDWAMDISKAEFTSGPSFEAVPGSLIRRDPETQVLITRKSLTGIAWQSLDFGTSAFRVGIQWFLDGSLFDDVVLVAPKKSRKFKEDLRVLEFLRREGIAC